VWVKGGKAMTESSTGRQAIIEASPEPITIDTARTAVIVVDMRTTSGAAAECSTALGSI
jgi:hypothetical protein